MMGPRIDMIAQTEQEKAKNRSKVFRRLMGEFAPHRKSLFVLLALTLTGAIAGATGPWLIGRALDGAVATKDRSGLTVIMGVLLLTYVVAWWTSRRQIVTMGHIGQSVMKQLRAAVFDKVHRLPVSYFDSHAAGDLQSRLVNDVDTLN